MDKKEIFDILDSWNEWAGQKDIGLMRNSYLDRLKGLVQGSNQVITITGRTRTRSLRMITGICTATIL